MSTEGLTGAISRQEWMKPAEETVQKALNQAFQGIPGGRQIEDALHGTWVGHPLHVILTDIPLGAWSAAMVFDTLELVTGRRDWRTAANASIAFGLLGAAGAALTGLTDWKDTDPPARRIGLVHGLLNVVGTGLYTASFLMRRRRSRTAGQVLSMLGYAVAVTSARLGGHLVYDERVGVDHTAGRTLPENFAAVLGDSELPEGQPRRVEYQGTPILLVRQAGSVYALAETCSHLGGPLAEGKVGDNSIQCPWHGSCFALDDGRVLNGPAVHPQPCLEVRIREGQIEVRKQMTARPPAAQMSAPDVQPVPDRP